MHQRARLLWSSAVLALAACGAPDPAPVEPDVPAQTATASAEPVVQATATPTVSATASATATADATPRPAREAITVPKELQAIVDAADRSAEDKALDAGRRPGEMLAFFDIKPGMKVAELGAGGGYTTELLARAVGAKGKVYAQNNKFIIEKFADKPLTERLKKPVMKNVVRVDREFDTPLPPDAKNLDAVYVNLFYHDVYWMNVDRAKMNKAVLDALKPGGLYVIIDHTGRTGTGATEVKTLHRIEESEVKKDIEAAGFTFDRQSAFLRNPADTLDWNDAPSAAGDKRGTSDRFALVFRKPK